LTVATGGTPPNVQAYWSGVGRNSTTSIRTPRAAVLISFASRRPGRKGSSAQRGSADS
jgi:hypothetical protein